MHAGRARILSAAALLLGAVLAPAAPALESLNAFPHSTLEIHTRSDSHRFSMWMKDTRIARDMLLIHAHGEII